MKWSVEMKKNVFKKLTVTTAFVLSTSFAFAAQIDERDLEPTGDIGKALAPLLARPEAADLKAAVENALATHTPIYSKGGKADLIAAIAKYEAASSIDTISMLSPDVASILVGKSAVEMEQEQINVRWCDFINSSIGARIVWKGDGELRFGSVAGTRASDFLANRPRTLAATEALIKEATDYYDVNQAFPRVIREVQDLKYQLAVTSISAGDVDTLFYDAGFRSIVRKLESMDGKGRIIEALEKIKDQQREREETLRDSTEIMYKILLENERLKKIIADSGISSFVPPSPPPANPYLAAAKAKTPDLFSGDEMPLYSWRESGENFSSQLSTEEQAAFQTTATDDK